MIAPVRVATAVASIMATLIVAAALGLPAPSRAAPLVSAMVTVPVG